MRMSPDDGRFAGLDAVRRTCQQCECSVRSEVHALEHGVAARVIAGEVVHAVLTKQHQTIKPFTLHGGTGPGSSAIEFVLGEVKKRHDVPQGPE